MKFHHKDYYLVESGNVHKGDVLRKIIREEIIVDSKIANHLNSLNPCIAYAIKEVTGYKLYRKKKHANPRPKALAEGANNNQKRKGDICLWCEGAGLVKTGRESTHACTHCNGTGKPTPVA